MRTPGDQTERKPINGMDYGVLPRIMAVASPEFGALWHDAGCVGLAYDVLPQFGVAVDIPVLYFVFRHGDKGKAFFELIKSWDAKPFAGSAVVVKFITDSDNQRYHAFLTPGPELTIERVFDADATRDFTVLTASATVGKQFDTGTAIPFLNSLVGKLIVIAPGSVSEGPYLGAALLKDDIEVIPIAQIGSDSIERRLLTMPAPGEDAVHRDLPNPTPQEVAERRHIRMKRFFPVTLWRLLQNASFVRSASGLHGYPEWRIQQAACNFVAKHRFRQPKRAGQIDFFDVYCQMRSTFEDPADASFLSLGFGVKSLEQQIQFDTQYLATALGLREHPNATHQLRQLKYL